MRRGVDYTSSYHMFKPIPSFATISLYYNIICTIYKQTTIDIYYIFATQYAAVGNKSKQWLLWSQDNVSTCISELAIYIAY